VGPHIAGVAAFLKRYDIALHHDTTFEAKLCLPKLPPFGLRDNASDKMRRAAVLHLVGKTGGGGFLVKRTYPYLSQVFVDAQVQHGGLGKIHPKTKTIVFSMLQFVETGFNDESEDAAARESLRLGLGGADAGLVADLAMEVIRAERSALATYLQGERRLADSLVHAQRYSQWAEDWANRHHRQEGDAAEVCASKGVHLKLWKAAKVTVPKAFLLLPVQCLQSRSVQFKGTALCSFFTDWLPREMERLAAADGALGGGRYEEADVDLAAAMEPIRACFDKGHRLEKVAENAHNSYYAYRKKHGYLEANCGQFAIPPWQPSGVRLKHAELDRTMDLAKEALAVHRDLEATIFAQIVESEVCRWPRCGPFRGGGGDPSSGCRQPWRWGPSGLGHGGRVALPSSDRIEAREAELGRKGRPRRHRRHRPWPRHRPCVS